jgi:hypothetical protein
MVLLAVLLHQRVQLRQVLDLGAATVGPAGATGFEQARQLLQMRAGEVAGNGLVKEGLGKIFRKYLSSDTVQH